MCLIKTYVHSSICAVNVLYPFVILSQPKSETESYHIPDGGVECYLVGVDEEVCDDGGSSGGDDDAVLLHRRW